MMHRYDSGLVPNIPPRHRILGCIAFVAFCLAGKIIAVAEPAPVIAASHAAVEPVAPIVVTAAVDKAILYFRELSAKDSNGWFHPPMYQNKIVDWKMEEFRYREIKVPVNEYETVQELVPASDPSMPMQMVTRQRIKRVIEGKYETREVRDPDGPIRKTQKTPIYEKGGPDLWLYGSWGINAMVIFALRSNGVSSDDPVVARPAEALTVLIEEFGLPDLTWDVAWLTAAFATFPDERYKLLTSRLAGKLLDAQIEAGPGEGLWGPIAVNLPLLAAELRVTLDLGARKSLLEKDLQAKGNAAPGQRRTAVRESSAVKLVRGKIEDINERLATLQELTTSEGMLGLKSFDLGDNNYRTLSSRQGNEVIVQKLPYFFYNQVAVDLESTALALFGLRVASDYSRLPNATGRSKVLADALKGATTKPLPPPRTPEMVGRRALASLLKLRTPAGKWTELNLHYPVNYFAGLPSVPPAQAKTFMPLPSPATFVSVAQGASAVVNAQVLSRQGGGYALQHPVCLKMSQALVCDTLKPGDVGGTVGAYEGVAFLGRNQARQVSGKPFDASSWNEVASWLLRKQDPATGAWGNGWHASFSSSLRARATILEPLTLQTVGKAYDKPNLVLAAYSWRGESLTHFSAPGAIFSTAGALLYLATSRTEMSIPPEGDTSIEPGRNAK